MSHQLTIRCTCEGYIYVPFSITKIMCGLFTCKMYLFIPHGNMSVPLRVHLGNLYLHCTFISECVVLHVCHWRCYINNTYRDSILIVISTSSTSSNGHTVIAQCALHAIWFDSCG